MQVATPSSTHSLSGSVPVLMFPQAPSEPEPFLAAVQAVQRLAHALSQHTLSAQKVPPAHSDVLVHVWPSAKSASQRCEVVLQW